MIQIDEETKSEVAAAALMEVEAGSGVALPEDKNGLAEYYTRRAFGDLASHRRELDPTAHASFSAEEAAVEYVKARLMGRAPEDNQAYLRKKQEWAYQAVLDVHKENEKEEDG